MMMVMVMVMVMVNDYIVELTDEDLVSDEAFDKHNDLWVKATVAMMYGESFNAQNWTWDKESKTWRENK